MIKPSSSYFQVQPHRLFWFLLFLTLTVPLFTSLAREVPPLTGPVVDEVGLLDGRELGALSASLQKLREQNGPQIQVLIIDSLDGDILEEYSIKVVEQWKLGGEKNDDGVLYLIAIKDRKMRIEVGQGLEGFMPDITAGKIIRSISPFFKKGQYKDGIFFGVQSIAEKLGYKLPDVSYTPPPSSSSGKGGQTWSLLQIFIFGIFFLILFLFGNRPRGHRRTPFWYGGSGGSSGGGSWGGGGGGFSGGGASGDW